MGMMTLLAFPSLGVGPYAFSVETLRGSTFGQKGGACLIPTKGSIYTFANIHGRVSH